MISTVFCFPLSQQPKSWVSRMLYFVLNGYIIHMRMRINLIKSLLGIYRIFSFVPPPMDTAVVLVSLCVEKITIFGWDLFFMARCGRILVWTVPDTYVACFLADFRDTWAFLDARVKDAFDLKKTIQEVRPQSMLWLIREVYEIIFLWN